MGEDQKPARRGFGLGIAGRKEDTPRATGGRGIAHERGLVLLSLAVGQRRERAIGNRLTQWGAPDVGDEKAALGFGDRPVGGLGAGEDVEAAARGVEARRPLVLAALAEAEHTDKRRALAVEHPPRLALVE